MTYELLTKLDGRKSFYKKAYVNVNEKLGVKELLSYNTRVAFIKNNTLYLRDYFYKCSPTTLRHLKEFIYQELGLILSLKEIDNKFKDNVLDTNDYIAKQI